MTKSNLCNIILLCVVLVLYNMTSARSNQFLFYLALAKHAVFFAQLMSTLDYFLGQIHQFSLADYLVALCFKAFCFCYILALCIFRTPFVSVWDKVNMPRIVFTSYRLDNERLVRSFRLFILLYLHRFFYSMI